MLAAHCSVCILHVFYIVHVTVISVVSFAFELYLKSIEVV